MPSAEGRSGPLLTLRTHLLLLVVGTVVPVLIVAGLLIRRAIDDNRAAVESALEGAARAQTSIVDRELTGTIRALQGLALSEHLDDGQLAAFRDQALRLQQEQPMWSAVILSRPDGQQVINTAAAPGTPLRSATDPAVFARVISERQAVIGGLRAGQVIQQMSFPVRVPVIRGNDVAYVLSALITSARFSDVLRREAPLSDEWVRGVVDADGVLVARSRDSELYVGQKSPSAFIERYVKTEEGAYRDVAIDGTPVYGGFSRAPYSRWVVGVAVPASVVDGAFNQSLAALGALGITLLGVGGVAAFVISGRIARDITGVAGAAEALARGERPRLPSSAVVEMRQLSDSLERSAELLETRERERNEQIARADQARRGAEAADRAKDDFLAMLGHELRNPLAPALTALQLIRHRHPDVAEREHDIIRRQIQHMARLVDDLLDVSRLRRGVIALRYEPYNLTDAIERAVEMTVPVYEEQSHELAVELPDSVTVLGDPVRMAQVFANLLTNAAKYTDPGGRVTLVGKVEGDHVVVKCRDTGIGMSPELTPHVFELFVQGERGMDRRQGGLGLGLALARALVERHHGTISAESAGPGTGSTFTVRLPCAAEGTAAPEPSLVPLADFALRPARVLVVDDNRDAVEMLVAALRDSGFDATGALEGIEALALASKIEPHAAVLDIGLPSMDGFQLARMLRRAAPATIRLIALTGYGQDHDMSAARAAGFERFFVKPASTDLLIAAINELLAMPIAR